MIKTRIGFPLLRYLKDKQKKKSLHTPYIVIYFDSNKPYIKSVGLKIRVKINFTNPKYKLHSGIMNLFRVQH